MGTRRKREGNDREDGVRVRGVHKGEKGRMKSMVGRQGTSVGKGG